MTHRHYFKKALYSAFFVLTLSLCWSCSSPESDNKLTDDSAQNLSEEGLSASINCPNFNQLNKASLQSSQVDWLPDGDTIHLKNGHKLRLLHINTPEMKPKQWSKTNKAEPFAKEAKEHLKDLIGSSNKVYWLLDQFINAELTAKGLAHTLIIPPNDRYWQCIHDQQNQARQNKQGLWKLASSKAKKVSEIKPDQGFQSVEGQITQIDDSRKYRWLIINKKLWVGIPRDNLSYFSQQQLNQFKTGHQLSLKGYIYQSHGKLRVKLNHPGMLL